MAGLSFLRGMGGSSSMSAIYRAPKLLKLPYRVKKYLITVCLDNYTGGKRSVIKSHGVHYSQSE